MGDCIAAPVCVCAPGQHELLPCCAQLCQLWYLLAGAVGAAGDFSVSSCHGEERWEITKWPELSTECESGLGLL